MSRSPITTRSRAVCKLPICLIHLLASRLRRIFRRTVQDSHSGLGNFRSSSTRDIVIVRDNIFALQRYLQGAQIAHAVAHPLYSINGKLDASHLERLILLFKHFEGINGLRDALLSDLAQTLFGSLTPEKIDKFANATALRRRTRSRGKRFSSAAPTITAGNLSLQLSPKRRRPIPRQNFSNFVRNGNCTARGQGGTPLALSHGFYNTVACFIQDRFHEKLGPSAALLEQMFSRFMEGRDPTEFTLGEKGASSRKVFCREKFLSSPSRQMCRSGKISPVISRGRK